MYFISTAHCGTNFLIWKSTQNCWAIDQLFFICNPCICIALFRICQYIFMGVLCFNTILNLHTGAYPPTDGYETIYCSTLGLNIMFGHMYDKILTRAMHMQRNAYDSQIFKTCQNIANTVTYASSIYCLRSAVGKLTVLTICSSGSESNTN